MKIITEHQNIAPLLRWTAVEAFKMGLAHDSEAVRPKYSQQDVRQVHTLLVTALSNTQPRSTEVTIEVEPKHIEILTIAAREEKLDM